ncbi:MAG: DUF3445 domain-containing protein [Microscillaceae bacterium]|nr:DUF3445 domain-containing protein [Microscillaceae bacterium]
MTFSLQLPKAPKYLPFLGGKYTTAPGLRALEKAETNYDRRVFQIDQTIKSYLENIRACRTENIHKYYHEYQLNPELIKSVNAFIIQEICRDYPDLFQLETVGSEQIFHCKLTGEVLEINTKGNLKNSDIYLSLFDALMSRIPEDMAIVQLESDRDFLSTVHVCAPSHWAPGEKIGKNFDSLHEPVPGMEKLRQNYRAMLQSIVERGAFTRFGWSVATDNRLNHHPLAQNSYGNQLGSTIDPQNPELFVRVERQNLIGFPAHQAFIFTVRIYFYAVNDLELAEKQALHAALTSMSPESARYKGLTNKMEFLLDYLA